MHFRVEIQIAGHTFGLDTTQVERSLDGLLPEPIKEHFVVVEGRRFPPKQVISAVTGLDRADFTTHQARSALRRLGFTVARRSTDGVGAPSRGGESLPRGGRQADALHPHVGRWVALRGEEVLVAADSFDDVVAWLERYDQHADMVFRVPQGPDETDIAFSG